MRSLPGLAFNVAVAMTTACTNPDGGQKVGRSNPPAAPRHLPPEVDVGPGRGVYHLSNELTAEEAATLGADASETSSTESTDETPVAEPTPAVAAPAADDSAPGVALARFTTAIENREPIDAISFLDNDRTEIFFYTDLRNLADTTITHRWEYEGKIVAEVPFDVSADRWRVWSSKKLEPASIGEWSASVVDADGEVLATERFSYQQP